LRGHTLGSSGMFRISGKGCSTMDGEPPLRAILLEAASMNN